MGEQKRDPWTRNRLIRDGFYEAVLSRMDECHDVCLIGEGAHMKAKYDAPELLDKHSSRVLTLPISEDANTNFGVGLSMSGLIPVIDIISSDFMYRTADAIINTVVKTQHIHSRRTVVLKGEFLTGGPTAGQRVERMFVGHPGLKVQVPWNKASAVQAMKEAFDYLGPTLFFEERMIDDAESSELEGKYGVQTSGPLARVQFGDVDEVETKRLTVVSYGYLAHQLVLGLTRDASLSAKDVDLYCARQIYPLPVNDILASAQQTGRLLIVEPDDVLANQLLKRIVNMESFGGSPIEVKVCHGWSQHEVTGVHPDVHYRAMHPSSFEASKYIFQELK